MNNRTEQKLTDLSGMEKAVKDILKQAWIRGERYGIEQSKEDNSKGDLISRAALLKAMEMERQYLLARGETGAEHILVHHCLPLIDNAPTIDTSDTKYLEDRDADAYESGFLEGHIEGYLKAEKDYAKPQGEWTPVSERLPEYSGLYLISVDDLVTVANFTGAYFMNRVGGRIEVSAWQPLPRFYKKGGGV